MYGTAVACLAGILAIVSIDDPDDEALASMCLFAFTSSVSVLTVLATRIVAAAPWRPRENVLARRIILGSTYVAPVGLAAALCLLLDSFLACSWLVLMAPCVALYPAVKLHFSPGHGTRARGDSR
jgi:hypothetical protein